MSFAINLSGCNQQQVETQLNPHVIAKDFCSLYYLTMSTKGMAGILHLFDQNAHCVYNGKEINGMYNVMSSVATEGVAKLVYDKLNQSHSVIDSTTLLVNTTGVCQGVTFWGQATTLYNFTETFVLKARNDRTIVVTNYIFKLI
jgi:hypothetical protein